MCQITEHFESYLPSAVCRRRLQKWVPYVCIYWADQKFGQDHGQGLLYCMCIIIEGAWLFCPCRQGTLTKQGNQISVRLISKIALQHL